MLNKIATALAVALVLTGLSLAFVNDASAAYAASSEQNWFDRATNGGAGHHAGDTNGF